MKPTACLGESIPDDTAPRRAFKRMLRIVLPQPVYSRLLARSKARDFRTGRLREGELDLLRFAIRPGETVIDIGANHGMWATALSPLLEEQGRALCFEPVPFTADVLRQVVGRLPIRNVEVVEKACGEEPGLVEITIPLQPSGVTDDMQAHLSARDAGTPQGVLEGKRVECEVVVLDSYVKAAENLSLIKVDIEGAELFALRGAQRLIAEHHPTIITEVDPEFLSGFGISAADMAEFASDNDYRLYRYENEPGRLVPVVDEAEVEHENWVMVHQARRERLRNVLADE